MRDLVLVLELRAVRHLWKASEHQRVRCGKAVVLELVAVEEVSLEPALRRNPLVDSLPEVLVHWSVAVELVGLPGIVAVEYLLVWEWAWQHW